MGFSAARFSVNLNKSDTSPKQLMQDVALKFVETVISAEAKGIMFGRNVFQSKDPAQFLKEAVAIVHGA
jgi:DhnA family fructose-bisphosphate aldolase class Ia